MPDVTGDIALVTEKRYEACTAASDNWYLSNILNDDGLLQSALSQHGLSAVRVAWSRPGVDWSAFKCAVFRSTWDYFHHIDEFSAWLDHLANSTMAINPLPLIRWNLDKHYLQDLRQARIPTVDTVYIERGSSVGLGDLLDQTGWEQAVIKPCVSGAARHTHRLSHNNADEVEDLVRPLIANESFLLQPFQQSIVQSGEDSLIIIDGRYSHAVRKVAKTGDYRVQDDFGGTARVCSPTHDQIELAEGAFAACGHDPVYGRVDMVRDNGGRFALMELELIEPELWLRFHPPAAMAFAKAIAARLAT